MDNNPFSPKLGGHAVLAVGFGLIRRRKYVKILNSWGAEQGDCGYTWVSEDYLAENAEEFFHFLRLDESRYMYFLANVCRMLCLDPKNYHVGRIFSNVCDIH